MFSGPKCGPNTGHIQHFPQSLTLLTVSTYSQVGDKNNSVKTIFSRIVIVPGSLQYHCNQSYTTCVSRALFKGLHLVLKWIPVLQDLFKDQVWLDQLGAITKSLCNIQYCLLWPLPAWYYRIFMPFSLFIDKLWGNSQCYSSSKWTCVFCPTCNLALSSVKVHPESTTPFWRQFSLSLLPGAGSWGNGSPSFIKYE